MENRDLTPEERLLRIIRKGKKAPAPKADRELRPERQEAPPETILRQEAKLADQPPAELSGLVFKAPGLVSVEEGSLSNFKLIEIGLAIVFCLLTAYLIFDISSSGRNNMFNISAPSVVNEDYLLPERNAAAYSDYEKTFSSKDLFIWKERAFVRNAAASEDMAKALSALSLMGVVDGATQQAVIFDRATQQSYFLNVGDQVGEFIVDAIESGKVTLDFKGEKVELFIALFSAPLSMAEVPQVASAAKISLDIKGMDILDVLKILAKQTGLNIVAGRNVTGKVTIFLKDVDSWDAFEIILAANNLAYEKKGDIINVITDRDYELKHGDKFNASKVVKAVTLRFAKASDLVKALIQVKSPLGKVTANDGSNTIIIVDVPGKAEILEQMIYEMDVPLVTEDYTFKYANVADIKDNFTDLLTPNVGIIKVDERMNKIIIKDAPQVIDEIIKVAKAYDDKMPQVFIEAEIIEISLNDDHELGVNWDAVFAGAQGTKAAGLISNLVGSTPLAANPITLTLGAISGDNTSLDMVLSALDDYGTSRSLSNPRLTVLNGQEAKVMVGTREPYATTSQSQASAGNTITADTINFIDIGTNLYIKPTINPDGLITMNIKPEISSALGTNFESPGGSEVPRVRSTMAETTVTIEDGQTIILGGLIEDKVEEELNRIPFLGYIPWLGRFFSYESKSVTKTELVIFITPKLIYPFQNEDKIAREEVKAREISADEYKRNLSTLIADKIREISGSNAKGAVELTFTLNNSGELLGDPKAKEKGRENANLRDVAIAAVKIASPFPPFPIGMSQVEESFNIAISFE